MAGLSLRGCSPRAVLTAYLLWVTRRESGRLPPQMAFNKPGAAASAGISISTDPSPSARAGRAPVRWGEPGDGIPEWVEPRTAGWAWG